MNLLIEGRPFSDNWIYVHSGAVDLARIANYRNFSPAMAADGISPLTVEYFAFRGDKFSGASDEAMVERAVSELSTLGLIERDQMVGGFVVRSEKAYPLMEIGHQLTSTRSRPGSISSRTCCRSAAPVCSNTTIRITPWRPGCWPRAPR